MYWISRLIEKHIDWATNENWKLLNLHDTKTCRCAKGGICRKKIKDANEKRRAFYKTAKGLVVQNAYKEKAAKKRQINQPTERAKIKK